MIVFRTRRWLLTCGSLYILFLGLLGMGSAAASGRDDGPAVQAIINHPNVALARANVCRARSSYDLALAGERPQVDFSLRGGTSLKSRFEQDTTRSRRFDDEDVDAVISLNQLLYDWGGIEASKKSALSEQAGNRLALLLEIDRVAADILDLGIKISEQQERMALYQGHLRTIAPQIERIEAGVEAGVLRVGDLRSIKLTELDAEIAITLSERQLDLLEGELDQRFGLNAADLAVFLARFRQHRPHNPPVIESRYSREIQRIDLQIEAAGYEIDRLEADRRPRLSSTFNSTFFDVDSFSQEYEITGELQLSLPLYDGGSNQARQDEETWRRRGLTNQRENTIRQHRNATESTQRNIDRARESLSRNVEKLSALDDRLDEARARLGQTTGDSLTIVNINEQIVGIRSEQIALSHQIELGILQGVFFADALSDLLDLPHGGPQC
ncbi:MAG: TolC family protein [Candidatus Puniceispirillales bacterium]